MKMVKCLKGHMYNSEKFGRCPHCANAAIMESVAIPQDEIDTEEPDIAKQQKYEIIGRRKVVGCLICTKGMMLGEGFFLFEGYNDIGRGANLEVVLSKELTVSRKAHACITYDKRKNQYYLVSAEGKKDVFYNGTVVEQSMVIENGGSIRIGQCNLRFVAFCNEEFSWEG